LTANGQAALDRARKLLYELIAAGDDINRERTCAFFYVRAEHGPPVLMEDLTFEDYVSRSSIEIQISADKQMLRVRLKTSLRVLRDLLIVTQPALALTEARSNLLVRNPPAIVPRLWVLDDFDIDCFETPQEVYANVPTFTREDAEELTEALPAFEQLDDLHGLIVLLAALREFIDRARREHPAHTTVRDSYDELWKHLCGAWLWSRHTDQLLEEQDVGDSVPDTDEQDLHKS
jgi:hypothetical protein